MFKSVVEKDKYGRNQTHYYLTQGDSGVIYTRPYKDGALLPVEQVEKCVFKLSDSDYKQEFTKELSVFDGHFRLALTSEETKNFAVDTHIYEFEYTLVGGAVNTPNQWKFDVTNQIIE